MKKPSPTHYTEAEFRKLLDYAKTLPEAWRDYDLGKFNEATAADFIATTSGKGFWDTTKIDDEQAELLKSNPELLKHRESKIAEYHRHKGPMYADLGRMAFEAFCKKDAQFFRNIALWIECNQADGPRVVKVTPTKDGREVAELDPITYPELGIKKGKGKDGKRWTLAVVFPLSIWELIMIREAFNIRLRITHNELRNRVNGNRRKGEGISDKRFNEHLRKWKFAEFLAERKQGT